MTLIMISSSFSISLHAFFNPLYSHPTPIPPPLKKFHPIKMHYENPPSCSPSVLRHDMWWWCCDDYDGVRVTPCRCPIKHMTNSLPPLKNNAPHPLTICCNLKKKSSSFIFLHLRTCRIWLVCNLSLSFLLHPHWPCIPQTPSLTQPSVIQGPSACASCMTSLEECNTLPMSQKMCFQAFVNQTSVVLK